MSGQAALQKEVAELHLRLAALESAGTSITYADLPAHVQSTVFWTPAGGFPDRPHSRTDLPVNIRCPLSEGPPPQATPPDVDGFYEETDAWEIAPEV